MNDLKAKISNAQIAELLAREAGKSEGILARAYKKAARSAFLWPEHACDLLSNGRSLTELKGIGPFMAKRLRDWLGQTSRENHAAVSSPGLSHFGGCEGLFDRASRMGGAVARGFTDAHALERRLGNDP